MPDTQTSFHARVFSLVWAGLAKFRAWLGQTLTKDIITKDIIKILYLTATNIINFFWWYRLVVKIAKTTEF